MADGPPAYIGQMPPLDVQPPMDVESCMIRDPRDAVVSHHALDQQRYWTPLHFWKKQIGHVRRLIGRRRFIVVKCEDLVTRPDSVQDEIMRRLPFLRKKTNFSHFHEVAAPSALSAEALGGVRPIAPGRIGNWRNHPASRRRPDRSPWTDH